MATIRFEIIGNSNFLRAAEYGMHIHGLMKEYEPKFKVAENVSIRFKEDINPNANEIIPNELEVSENGKSINLIYKISRYIQPKNELSKPSVQEFFRDLQYYLDNKVVREDHERFEQLKDTQEE